MKSPTLAVLTTIVLSFFQVPYLIAVQSESVPVQIRFIDAATGCAVQPDEVLIESEQSQRKRVEKSQIHSSGRASISLGKGHHAMTALSSAHRPLQGDLQVTGDGYKHQFVLEPIQVPSALARDRIVSLHSPESMALLGFVSDDQSGQALDNVRVRFLGSVLETRTDASGFFELVVPLPKSAGQGGATGALIFEKDGFKAYQMEPFAMWPNGDWTFRISMEQSNPSPLSLKLVDPVSLPDSTSDGYAAVWSESNDSSSSPSLSASSQTNATLRVPRTIRVLQQDGVTIDYVSLEGYVKRSLPHEWPATWGQFTGSHETFKAGSVADRSYAAAYVNAPRATAYDICGTTACQVYIPGTTYTATDAAIDETTGYVLLSGSSITFSEYSAENNSLGYSCGDGYTSPTGGCIYDPVCAGQTRSGHGRGMCQWGTLRWGTGLKFAGNWNGYPDNGKSGVTNGYPTQDWLWMVSHYYPNLKLVRGTQLIVGDDVKASASIQVRMNSDGSISNATAAGVNCPLVTTKSSGAIGVIMTNTPNPLWVTNDNYGYTWYKIKWSDGVIGWSPENWLQRVVPLPLAPTNVLATAISPSQINLRWSSSSTGPLGFKVKRALSASGPWTTIVTNAGTDLEHSDTNLAAATTYYYQVIATHVSGDSPASSTASATTLGEAPDLNAIANRTICEGVALVFTNTVRNPDMLETFSDFENYALGAQVMFRQPRYSGSTTPFLDTTPDIARVTNVFPAGPNLGSRSLTASWSFKTITNAWLRLTTGNATNLPNPVIDFRKRLWFDIYTDKALQVALCCRETTNAAGTLIGTNGGAVGSIEFVGAVTNTGTAPVPTRTVSTGLWTSLSFNIPAEPVVGFTGNGVLSTASGLGVLEALALVPAAGPGTYNVFLDNFAVGTPKTLRYSFVGNVPSGATLDAVSGVFSWTPTLVQAPSTNNIRIRVTDSSSGLSDTNTFSVTVFRKPQFNAVTVTGNTITFRWNGYPGQVYRIEWKSNIEDLSWNILTEVTAQGDAVTINDSVGVARRFYRVSLVK